MLTNGNLGVVLTCILANFSCFDPLGSYNFGEFRGNTKYCVCFDILNFLDGVGRREESKYLFIIVFLTLAYHFLYFVTPNPYISCMYFSVKLYSNA